MYFTFDDLTALIPEKWVVESLDDEGSGEAEMFSEVQAAAATAVNAPLSIRYATPVAATPFICRTAVLIAAENCYGRRSLLEQFPFKDELKDCRSILKQMAKGEIELAPATKPVNPSGGFVSEPSHLTHRGKLSV